MDMGWIWTGNDLVWLPQLELLQQPGLPSPRTVFPWNPGLLEGRRDLPRRGRLGKGMDNQTRTHSLCSATSELQNPPVPAQSRGLGNAEF